MFNMVIFGPPGCGKGTQAAKIVENYNLLHISTGDLIRKEISQNTILGKIYDKFNRRGILVPDDLILKEIFRYAVMNRDAKGFVFDGFPRNLYQAQMLDRVFAKKQYKIELVVSIDVPEDELIARVLERGKTSGRIDDNEVVMHNRLLIYFSQTQPVIDYYKRTKRLYEVDGNQSIETVASLIDEKIKKVMGK
ncbi:MAG: adenylate kinase [Bacteroidales bacterium]|jgi:adenylate kinase|nr:adenylate kinase [Bacteroidales bacterium]